MRYAYLSGFLRDYNCPMQFVPGVLVFLSLALFSPKSLSADPQQCPTPLPPGVTCQIVVYPPASSLDNPDFDKLNAGIDSLLSIAAYTLPTVWAVGIFRRIVIARL